MRPFVATILVSAVGVLAGAPVADAAGGLLSDVTAPLADSAQSSQQAPSGALAPVVETVAPVVQTAADTVAPVTTTTAPLVGTVAKTAAPVVQTVVEAADPVVKPVVESTQRAAHRGTPT